MNWKDQVKNRVGQAELLKALNIMEKHAINVSSFKERLSKYKKLEDKVLREERTYTSAEYQSQSSLHNQLAFDMLNAVDGVVREMPEYLKV